MTDLIAGTEFERNLRACSERMTDRDFRRLVFAYCQRYQDVYCFDQLENAFAYLEIAFDGDSSEVRDELPAVRSEVQDAMVEYFESLNEVAAAIATLLDDTPLTADDAILCVAHVWSAHACNEDPIDFRPREDKVLCDLLAKIASSQ